MAKTPNNKSFVKRITPQQYPAPGKFEEDKFPKAITSSGTNEGEFHIDFLKTQFRDLARPNQFKVQIQPPSVLQAEWNTKLTVLAKSAMFPSIEVSNFELERAGQVLHIPSNKMNYGDLTITFWNDVNFEIRTLMNRWQRLAIYNWQKNLGSVPLLALEGMLTIYQFDSALKEMYAIQLDNCWPKSISEISLDQDSTDQAESFSVSFVFTNHEILKQYQ